MGVCFNPSASEEESYGGAGGGFGLHLFARSTPLRMLGCFAIVTAFRRRLSALRHAGLHVSECERAVT